MKTVKYSIGENRSAKRVAQEERIVTVTIPKSARSRMTRRRS